MMPRILSLVLLLVVAFDGDTARGQRDRCGLGDILNGKQNPSGRRRSAAPPTIPATTSPVPKPVVGTSERSEYLKKRIEELRRQDRSTITPVNDMQIAKNQIAKLKERRSGLKLKADGETQKTVQEVARQAKDFQDKWGQIAKDVLSGKAESELQWQPTYDLAARKLQDKDILDFKPIKSIDEKLSPDGGNTGSPASGDSSVKAKQVSVPTFKDLKEAFAKHKKPRSMLGQRWAWLQDRFYRDLANLQSNAAAARRALNRRHAEQLSGIDRAIASAERALDRLAAEHEPSDDVSRELAWRIHQARIRELQELHDRQVAADESRRRLGEHPLIEMHPLDPARTLNQIVRAMDTNSRPPAPQRGQFNELTTNGLPELYPTDKGLTPPELMDQGIQYGELMRARIERNQRHLERLNHELASVEQTIRQEDADELKSLAALLHRNDLERERAEHPVDQARRRVRIKEKALEQSKSREARIAERRKQIEGDIQAAQRQMTKAYDRLDKYAPATTKD